MDDAQNLQYVLGLDLGTNSLGWAVIGLVDGEPARLVRAGVRVFEAGMDEGKGLGREESRNKARRDARLQRRQTWRRARRLKKVFNLLQRYGLLPGGEARTPEARQDLLNDLDRKILSSNWFAAERDSGRFPAPDQTMPYILRAAALDERLEPHFLGRALYHLAQRRGFLSNRRAAARDDDEGMVKKEIGELRGNMERAGARTLGEHFALLRPSEQRIRGWHTHREMYLEEFEKIWTAQAVHHREILTDVRKKELRNALFFQRPLWLDPNAVGKCELEPGHRRAPAYLLASQRFRLLQTVNNLRILPPGEPDRALTDTDRQKVIGALEVKRELSFNQIRKLLGLTREYRFNLESGGEKRLKGNRTGADFHGALGDRWLAMSSAERDRLVEYVHGFQNPGKLAGAAAGKWNVDDDAARKLAAITFEPEYVALSRRAIGKVLPLLERGLTYAEARRQVYPESFEASDPKPLLPSVDEALPDVRNPAVVRSLTELRKVTNAVIRQYGKPTTVRIELARSLKQSRKQREAVSLANRSREQAGANARREIIKQAGIAEPSPSDVRKFLLAEECHWTCPYTGRAIPVGALFGPEPQFDIEHIIPFSVSMDNSFQNLTLCYVPENRSRKGNRTPHQAYSGDEGTYRAILDRVGKFWGDRKIVAAKLKRFLMDDEQLEKSLEDFRSRQLNDTAYASALASRYLGLLYGGVNDSEGRRRVQATSGQATGYFRSLWQLNSILNDGPTANGGHVPKSRDDHRHHAIDALVIGLTDAAMVKRLSDAAQRAPAERRRRFGSLAGPWPDFTDSVRAGIDGVVASHRVCRKVGGVLHKETNYTPREWGRNARRHRVPIASLTEKDVAGDGKIADPGVRNAIRARLEELGGGDPGKLFARPDNLPHLVTADGRKIPIRRVRVQEVVKTRKIGDGPRSRHVRPGANHHVEIFAQVAADGLDDRWGTPGVVTVLDAHERLRKSLPVVSRAFDQGWEFRFSIAPGEILFFAEGPHKGSLFVVRTISEEEKTGSVKVEMVPVNDARQKGEIRKFGLWVTKSPNELRKWGARKVVIGPLGDVSEAHD